jgi:hypothetical protein
MNVWRGHAEVLDAAAVETVVWLKEDPINKWPRGRSCIIVSCILSFVIPAGDIGHGSRVDCLAVWNIYPDEEGENFRMTLYSWPRASTHI